MKILHILGLASLLWLTGCATTNTPGDNTPVPLPAPNDTSTSQAPQYPAGPLRPITAPPGLAFASRNGRRHTFATDFRS